MPQGLPDTAVCISCGYRLRGLPGNVCPECGRGFDAGDASSYRVPVERGRFWSPIRLVVVTLVFYIAFFLILCGLNENIKSAVPMMIQPPIMIVAAAAACVGAGWAWWRREDHVRTTALALLLLLFIVLFHLPNYVFLLEDIAAVRALHAARAGGS